MKPSKSTVFWSLTYAFLLALLAMGCSYFIPTSTLSIPSSNQPTITPALIQTYFPKQEQHPEEVLIQLYNNSKTTLDIAIYSLTYPKIVESIVQAKKRGVEVRVISDKIQAAGNTQKHAINTLLEVGIKVKINTHSGLMHLKMSLIDKIIATTGSYNYTANATDNSDEMLVVIQDGKFINECQTEFDRIWNNNLKYTWAVRSY